MAIFIQITQAEVPNINYTALIHTVIALTAGGRQLSILLLRNETGVLVSGL